MKLYKESKFDFNAQYNRLKQQWAGQMDNSLLSLAQWLITYDRHDQAKEIYEQMLNEKSDQQTKMICYQGLGQIAEFKGNSDEMTVYIQKYMELKCGSQHASAIPEGIL